MSGSLNNLIPVVIKEMKSNPKDSKQYIEFLIDNEITDY